MTTFEAVERRLVDFLDASGVEPQQREGEWFIVVEGEEVSITGMALAVARDLLMANG